MDGNGNLYGTTLQGAQGACPIGSSGCGTVFRLSPAPGGAWTETTLYQFTGGDDGGNPFSVVLDSSGNLYGTTAYGGSATVGTAFELSSDSGGNYTFSLLHAFGSSSQDISYPTSGLVVDKARNLYGTASLAGIQGYGAVYELSPSTTALWNISTIHSFTGKPDGSEPFSGVTVDSAGSIYGATAYGGRAAICPAPYPTGYLGCGTIFKLTPGSNGWTETVIYSFTGRGDGAFPLSSVSVDGAGNILTTTSAGGGGNQGTVLELIP